MFELELKYAFVGVYLHGIFSCRGATLYTEMIQGELLREAGLRVGDESIVMADFADRRVFGTVIIPIASEIRAFQMDYFVIAEYGARIVVPA
ncbi:hypothetical protein FNU76_17430 [Chitinimonas arctica]|uniref:Uncharacterized protein n=1 Tax=Chitinimonas arctica TaxID=2594795 RepID=A0A516SIL6_9NEIS|nr:hypothetical protein [Chitinimonas arctica]QDQ27983.1 hypothetical protein FNU76_17430 [Chitinimonas arctica]